MLQAVQVEPGAPVLPSTELIEGWNDMNPWGGSYAYGAACFGIPFHPIMDYSLERIEFYTYGGSGQVTVSILGGGPPAARTGPSWGA